jgi:hypothetical protein
MIMMMVLELRTLSLLTSFSLHIPSSAFSLNTDSATTNPHNFTPPPPPGFFGWVDAGAGGVVCGASFAGAPEVLASKMGTAQSRDREGNVASPTVGVRIGDGMPVSRQWLGGRGFPTGNGIGNLDAD